MNNIETNWHKIAWAHLHRHENDKSMRYVAKLNRSLGRKQTDKLLEKVAQGIEITGGVVVRYTGIYTNHDGTTRRVDAPPVHWRVC